MDGIGWFETLSLICTDWLQIATEAAAYAGLLAAAVLAVNVLFRRWLSAGQMGLLWGLVLLRLVVPAAPGSSLSLESLLQIGEKAREVDLVTPAASPVVTAHEFADPVQRSNEMSPPTAAAGGTDEAEWQNLIFSGVPLIWIIGGAGGLVYTAASYARFRRRVSRAATCVDERIVCLWAQCCERAGVKHTGRIVQFDGFDQPAVMGVFRPTLLLPLNVSELDDEQLRMIMLHELAHVRRRDIAANWALLFIRTIHWWNPVFWLAAARFRSLREQACDAFVVRQAANHATQSYGELLLLLAKRRPMAATWRVMLPATILSFFPSLFRQRTLRVRLKALRRAKVVRGRWQTAVVAVAFLLLAVSGFTTATEKQTEPMDLATWMARDPDVVLAPKRSYVAREEYNGPPETREYDIAECLDKITEEAGSKDTARKTLEATLNMMYSCAALHGDANESPSGANTGSPLKYSIADTNLTVTAPAALHEKLRRTLAAWGESGMAQITVETRFLSANHDLVSELGITWEFLEAFSSEREESFPTAGRDGSPVVHAEARIDEYLPLVVATLSKEQTTRLIETALGHELATVLNAPKVTIFNGQEAMFADRVQRPFVVGVFQRVVGANEPKIVVLEEGTTIRVRGVHHPELQQVHLEASLDMRSLGDVATASTSYRGGQVSIQVPRVNRRNIDVATDLSEGETLLVGFIPTGTQKQFLYYLLSAARIAESSRFDLDAK